MPLGAKEGRAFPRIPPPSKARTPQRSPIYRRAIVCHRPRKQTPGRCRAGDQGACLRSCSDRCPWQGWSCRIPRRVRARLLERRAQPQRWRLQCQRPHRRLRRRLRAEGCLHLSQRASCEPFSSNGFRFVCAAALKTPFNEPYEAKDKRADETACYVGSIPCCTQGNRIAVGTIEGTPFGCYATSESRTATKA